MQTLIGSLPMGLASYWRQSYLRKTIQPWRRQQDSFGKTCVLCMIEITKAPRLEELSPLLREGGGSSGDHKTGTPYVFARVLATVSGFRASHCQIHHPRSCHGGFIGLIAGLKSRPREDLVRLAQPFRSSPWLRCICQENLVKSYSTDSHHR